MTKPFRLKHIGGAPMLTPGAADEQVRNLGEAIRLLDSEPVIVLNLGILRSRIPLARAASCSHNEWNCTHQSSNGIQSSNYVDLRVRPKWPRRSGQERLSGRSIRYGDPPLGWRQLTFHN
jgi:hypothetical protein